MKTLSAQERATGLCAADVGSGQSKKVLVRTDSDRVSPDRQIPPSEKYSMNVPSTASVVEEFEVTREDLYAQVWVTPINHLAEKFGVSGSYLARICEALKVPRPPVGYWQKMAVGKAKPRPFLPPALPGDQLSWSKDRPIAAPKSKTIQRNTNVARTLSTIRAGRHPMLVGVEGHFRKTRKLDEGEFLRPYKLLLPDIVTSENCLLRALDIADEIYKALDQKGHRVQFALPDQRMHRVHIEEREAPGKDRKYGRYGTGNIWSPHRPTITYVGSMPIGLALIEMTEQVTMRYIDGKYVRDDSKVVKSARPWQLTNSWTTERDIPCGRFRLVAYSPVHGVDWVKVWQETAKASFGEMIPAFLRTLESSEAEIRALMTSAEVEAARRQREWEERQERWRREEDQRQVKQASAESGKQLSDIMDRWTVTVAIERFFSEAEKRTALLDGERRTRLMERLALAKKMIGTLDPLDFLEEWLAPEERYKSKYGEG